MQRVYIFHAHKNCGARRRVAVVFAQVQRQVGPADLRIQWKIGLKPVFPIQLETQKVQIKLFGFFLGEDSQDGDGGGNFHRALSLGEWVQMRGAEDGEVGRSVAELRRTAQKVF